MNKMNPKDIKNVLECCANSDGCKNCPYSKQCDGVEHLTNALAYINQLEADKMALESTINRLSHKILDCDYQHKQADENLKVTMNYVDYYKREYLQLEAEVERLKARNSSYEEMIYKKGLL